MVDTSRVRPGSLDDHRELVAQWLPRMFQWANDAILLVDVHHHVVGVNAAAERLFELSTAEALGRPIVDFVQPSRRTRIRHIQTLAERHLQPGTQPGEDEPFRFDWVLPQRDGSFRNVTMTVSGIRDDYGRILGYGIVAVDVTAARRAEAIQRALAKLSTTALELHDVGAVFDVAVSVPFACLDADHVTLFEMLPGGAEVVPVAQAGWPRPELLRSFRLPVVPGTPLALVLTTQAPNVVSDTAAEDVQKLPRVITEFGVHVGAAVNVCVSVGGKPWGTLCASWSERRVVGADEADMLQTVANVLATVIERERNEQLRLQHERMLRLGALGQMAAGVAHDLANVLAGIETLAAVEAARPDAEPGLIGSLQRVQAEAQLGHQIIDDILDFARLAPIDPEVLALGDWVRGQRAALASALPTGVDLRVEVAGPGPSVAGDDCGLRRILDNLVANAADAVAGRGTVTVRVGVEHVGPLDALVDDGLPAGEWARIDVSDDGSGIAEDVLPHVFEPFFTTKKHRRGTGLGLAQVHGLALQHGGQVTVASVPGEGSTFTVWLPLAG